MDMTHLKPFLDGMHGGDADALADHMSEDVVLNSPILAEPVRGKSAVAGVLAALLHVADSFEVRSIVAAEGRAAVFVAIRAGDVVVEGVDDMHVDRDGLVSSMTIQWRPLPAVVAMQQLIAPVIGAPVMKLVAA